MAFTPEERVARTVARVFDSLDLNTRLAARFTINNMGPLVQSKFFDFILYCIAEFHSQTDEEHIGYRGELTRVIYEAAEKEGFQLTEYSSYQE